jgi:hypothetical protein
MTKYILFFVSAIIIGMLPCSLYAIISGEFDPSNWDHIIRGAIELIAGVIMGVFIIRVKL